MSPWITLALGLGVALSAWAIGWSWIGALLALAATAGVVGLVGVARYRWRRRPRKAPPPAVRQAADDPDLADLRELHRLILRAMGDGTSRAQAKAAQRAAVAKAMAIKRGRARDSPPA